MCDDSSSDGDGSVDFTVTSAEGDEYLETEGADDDDDDGDDYDDGDGDGDGNPVEMLPAGYTLDTEAEGLYEEAAAVEEGDSGVDNDNDQQEEDVEGPVADDDRDDDHVDVEGENSSDCSDSDDGWDDGPSAHEGASVDGPVPRPAAALNTRILDCMAESLAWVVRGAVQFQSVSAMFGFGVGLGWTPSRDAGTDAWVGGEPPHCLPPRRRVVFMNCRTPYAGQLLQRLARHLGLPARVPLHVDLVDCLVLILPKADMRGAGLDHPLGPDSTYLDFATALGEPLQLVLPEMVAMASTSLRHVQLHVRDIGGAFVTEEGLLYVYALPVRGISTRWTVREVKRKLNWAVGAPEVACLSSLRRVPLGAAVIDPVKTFFQLGPGPRYKSVYVPAFRLM